MLAPVLAWNLSSSPARTKQLTIDGLSVLQNPNKGNTYAVDPASIAVTEAGPGTVSSMGFDITDPQGEISVTYGQFVVFWDCTLDLPIFVGWIESFATSRLGLGRTISVTCIGIETLLDWMYVPAMTLPAGTEWYAGFQAIAAAAGGIGYAMNTNAPAGGGLSTVATPVGIGFGAGNTLAIPVVIPSGSLRQALQVWADQILGFFGPDITAISRIVFTVDFYGGLRVYRRDVTIPGAGPSDVGGIQLKSTGGGAQGYPSGTQYGVNGSGIPHTIYVAGGSAAGSGFMSDGSGIVGPTHTVSDNNSVSSNQARALGFGRLPGSSGTITGQVTAEGGATMGAFAGQRRGMSYVELLDVQAGLAAATRFYITSIDKAWARSGEETWTIKFGGAVTRGSQYLRRLTAGQIV